MYLDATFKNVISKEQLTTNLFWLIFEWIPRNARIPHAELPVGYNTRHWCRFLLDILLDVSMDSRSTIKDIHQKIEKVFTSNKIGSVPFGPVPNSILCEQTCLKQYNATLRSYGMQSHFQTLIIDFLDRWFVIIVDLFSIVKNICLPILQTRTTPEASRHRNDCTLLLMNETCSISSWDQRHPRAQAFMNSSLPIRDLSIKTPNGN